MAIWKVQTANVLEKNIEMEETQANLEYCF